LPFDEEIEDLSKLKMRGKNDKSMFKDSIVYSEDFEEKVKEIEKKKQKYKKEIAALSLQLKKILEDKTLVQNKTELNKTIESDVLRDIVDLAGKINSDPSEQEGMGSLLLCTILLRSIILFRDRENNLEFKIFQLESKIKQFPELIEKRIERLEKAKNGNNNGGVD